MCKQMINEGMENHIVRQAPLFDDVIDIQNI